MRKKGLAYPVLACALTVLTGQLYAQSASAPPAADASAASTPKVLHVSTEYIKQLANAGYYPKNHGGQVVFCKKEAPLGTRFVSEHCLDGPHLEIALQQFAAQRDYLTRTDQLEQPPTRTHQ